MTIQLTKSFHAKNITFDNNQDLFHSSQYSKTQGANDGRLVFHYTFT